MLNLTKCKAIVGALFLTIGSVSAQDTLFAKPSPNQTHNQQQSAKQSSNDYDYDLGFSVNTYLGYMLGLGDYASDAVDVGLKFKYRFNPYFAAGATAGTSMYYELYDLTDEITATGTVNFTADIQGVLPIDKKVALFGELGFGVGIGYGWCNTDYLLQVGPGIRIGQITLSAIYQKFGEGDGGISFRLGFGF